MLPEIKCEDLDDEAKFPFLGSTYANLENIIIKFVTPILIHYYKRFAKTEENKRRWDALVNKILLTTALWRCQPEEFLIPTLTLWEDLLEKDTDVLDIFLLGWYTGAFVKRLEQLEKDSNTALKKKTKEAGVKTEIDPRYLEVYKIVNNPEGKNKKLSEALMSVFHPSAGKDGKLNSEIAKLRSNYHRQIKYMEEQKSEMFDFLIRNIALMRGGYDEGFITLSVDPYNSRTLSEAYKFELSNRLKSFNSDWKFLLKKLEENPDISIESLKSELKKHLIEDGIYDPYYIFCKTKKSFILHPMLRHVLNEHLDDVEQAIDNSKSKTTLKKRIAKTKTTTSKKK